MKLTPPHSLAALASLLLLLLVSSRVDARAKGRRTPTGATDAATVTVTNVPVSSFVTRQAGQAENSTRAATVRSADDYGLYFAVAFYLVVVGLLVSLVCMRLRRLRRTSLNATVLDAVRSFFSSALGGSGSRAAAQSGLSLGGPAAVHLLSAGAGGGGGGGAKRAAKKNAVPPSASSSQQHVSNDGGGGAGQAESGLVANLQKQLYGLLHSDAVHGGRKEKTEDGQGHGGEVAIMVTAPGNVERRDTGGGTHGG